MRITAIDSIFTKGYSHQVCEDYARHGLNYMIVSDGCSSSSGSDIGARLITLALSELMEEPNTFFNSSIRKLQNLLIVKLWKLMDVFQNQKLDILDATIVVAAYDNKTGFLRIWMQGDGHVFLHDAKKDIWIHEYMSYPSNAPYYLSYQMDWIRNERYKQISGTVKGQWCKEFIFPSGGIIVQDTIPLEWGDIYLGKDQWDFDKIVISSDGIDSFVSVDESMNLPKATLYEELFSFKNYTGAFLTRRVNKMVMTQKKLGYDHYDDLGIGAMIFDREE